MSKKDVPAYITENDVFPTRLREIMTLRGTNQTRLAAQIKEDFGITTQRQSISKYMNGQTKPDVDTITIICKALNVSADYLLGLTDEITTNMDERAASEYTRLSVKSIQKIRDWADGGRYIKNDISRKYTENKPLRIIELINNFFERTSTYHAFDALCAAIVMADYTAQHPWEYLDEVKIQDIYENLPNGYEIITGSAASKFRFSIAEKKFSSFVRFMENKYKSEQEVADGIDET